MSHGFKISITLAMPTDRPKKAPVCPMCKLKHNEDLECDTGMSPGGELKLPAFDGSEDGTEMIDKGDD